MAATLAEAAILRPGAVALVTGASAGFGVAIAEALVAKGCRVICAARRGDRLERLAERLGPDSHPFALEQPAHVVVAELVVVPTSQW